MGFRSKHSTIDHIYLLKCIIDIFLATGRKLYAVFVDYAKAFDTVWRAGLWHKLIKWGVNGKVLRVIQNLYSGIKSQVLINGCVSEYFSCNTGVRQGENLSPLLFSLYVNDLEEFLHDQGCSPINVCNNDDIDVQELNNRLKLLVVMYADDTATVSETSEGLQAALNALDEYCDTWKLKINKSKTKVVIFSKRKVIRRQVFTINDVELEKVDSFKYLGIVFNHNGSFLKCKKHVFENGQRAMWCLLKKCRKLSLPPSIQLKLFDQTVLPVLTYGCEVWGFERLDLIEKLHLRFCKLILQVNKSTPSCMIYGELGRYPVSVTVKTRVISYWCKLLSGPRHKYAHLVYKLCYRLHNSGTVTMPWISFVKNILDELGLSNVWIDQEFSSSTWLVNSVKLKLRDQAFQTWTQSVRESGKCFNYGTYKTELRFEDYLDDLPWTFAKALCHFRVANHCLPVERGRYIGVPRHERLCTACNSNRLGDEYHFLLECSSLQNSREKLFPSTYCTRPNMIKFINLMQNNSFYINIGKFIKANIHKVT